MDDSETVLLISRDGMGDAFAGAAAKAHYHLFQIAG